MDNRLKKLIQWFFGFIEPKIIERPKPTMRPNPPPPPPPVPRLPHPLGHGGHWGPDFKVPTYIDYNSEPSCDCGVIGPGRVTKPEEPVDINKVWDEMSLEDKKSITDAFLKFMQNQRQP